MEDNQPETLRTNFRRIEPDAPLAFLTPEEADQRLRNLTQDVDPVLDIVIPEEHLPDYLRGLGWAKDAIVRYLSTRAEVPQVQLGSEV